jgi:hypothetical protein
VITVMPYYQVHEAERRKGPAERRQAELRVGRAAARTSALRGRLALRARLALLIRADIPAGTAENRSRS